MIKIHILTLAVLALVGVLYPASAQPPEPVTKSWHVIEIQHRRAGYMAWMLDPENNPEPFELLNDLRITNVWRLRRTDPQEQQEGIIAEPRLPRGIEMVIGVDARNELLAYGTESGAKALRKRVAFVEQQMSRPQVEIAGYEVEMDAEVATAFGIDFEDKIVSALPFVWSKEVPEDYKAQLDALVAQGKARIRQEFREITTDNRAVRLGVTTVTPVRVQSDAQGVELHTLVPPEAPAAVVDAAPKKDQIYLVEYSGLTVTPSIGRDNLIELSFSTDGALSLRYPNGAPDAVLQFPLSPPLRVYMRRPLEGATKVVAKRQTRPRQEGQPDTQERVRVYFVTPRIIEPVEEI